MAEKSEGMWTRLLTDWRVILLVICLLISIILLGPSYSNGQLNTNLKFGLDFDMTQITFAIYGFHFRQVAALHVN